MTTNDNSSEFLFLFRGGNWDHDLSPAELQRAMSEFLSWFERLNAAGILKAGQPLMDDARIVSGPGGRVVADGPFAESKEAVGGYFLIRAGSFDEAVVLAKGCPILEHGGAVEVRPIAAVCPTLQRVRETTNEALEPHAV
jgi:hypothetical protein